MTPLLWFLFAASVACDVSGQLCFKRGADGLGEGSGGSKLARLGGYLKGLARAPWLWAGIGIYALELIIWLAILERAPLSLAFPMASLNYCGVIVASKFLLGEQVSKRRWAGAVLITMGVAIVGLGSEG